MLEAVDLDRSAIVYRVEVLRPVVGRVTGGDHETVAVRASIERFDPFLEVGDLPGVAPASEVERPDLCDRFVVAGIEFFALRVGLVVREVPRGQVVRESIAFSSSRDGEAVS